jgi:cyanophycin synthetase
MRSLDARRLTGVNLDLDAPGAIAEVAFDPGDDVAQALATWREAVLEATAALGWTVELAVRRWTGDRGASLAFTAPPDALYVAVDVTEWAVARAIDHLRGEPSRDLHELLPEWRAARERERVAHLSDLQAAADARGVPLLLDDDHLSLGAGPGARTWPRGEPPAPADVPWERLSKIPIALITGTNGKTTTARLLARIAAVAGYVPGNTSTDGLAVAERLVEAGDWTGPGAARLVLRDPRVTLAVLEVARGGILRRGLAIDRCDAACITNVSPDHLGEHGIDDLAAMTRVKAVVTRVVAPHGRIILGADPPAATTQETCPPGHTPSDIRARPPADEPATNPLLDLAGASLPAPLVWFARDPNNPQLQRHRRAGGEVWFVSAAGELTRGRGDEPDVALVPVAELPFCFGGAAAHNVANALAAAALAAALGLPDAAIAAGLRSFVDNPGRAQLVELGGFRLFLDFAHNPAGIVGLAPLLARLRGGGRLLVSIGVAGDRRDDDIRDIARALASLGPDLVLTRDLEHYLRGRAPGDVPALLEESFAALGIASERVSGEVAAIRRGLQWARPGDVLAILAHVERDEVWDELRALGLAAP